MPKYKIVASDLDGTLLDSNSQISEENISAIKDLIRKGVHFVPSSGRTLSEMPQAIKENTDIRFISCSNGAAVIDRKTGERILMCIPHGLAVKVLDILNSYETHIAFRHNGECYVDSAFKTDEQIKYFNVCDIHLGVVKQYAVFKDDFKNFSYSLDNIEVFAVFFRSVAEMEECRERLSRLGDLRIADSWNYNLEICSAHAGKGNALKALADKLGIDYADTIGVGDSDNDSTMIKAAGLGLAMENACDSLKKIADGVICTNNEHAIKYILEHYF